MPESKIKITGDNKDFLAKLGDAKKELGQTFQGIQAGPLGGLLSAGVWGTVATLGVMAFTRIGDAMRAMADRLTQSLQTGIDVEAIKSIEQVAKLSAVPLEAMMTAMEKIQTTMLKAKLGNEDAKQSIDALGLSLEKLDTMTPEQRFRAFGAALSAIDEEAKRTAIGLQAIGLNPKQVDEVVNAFRAKRSLEGNELPQDAVPDVAFNPITGKVMNTPRRAVQFTEEQKAAQDELVKKFAGIKADTQSSKVNIGATPVDPLRRIGAIEQRATPAQQSALDVAMKWLPEIVALLKKQDDKTPDPTPRS